MRKRRDIKVKKISQGQIVKWQGQHIKLSQFWLKSQAPKLPYYIFNGGNFYGENPNRVEEYERV